MEKTKSQVELNAEDVKEVSGGVNYSVFYQCTSCGHICGCDIPDPPPCSNCGGTVWVPYAGPIEVNE